MIGYKSKIYVAGHKGLVGSSILRKLNEKGYKNIIYADSRKLDLTNQNKVFNFLFYFKIKKGALKSTFFFALKFSVSFCKK